MERMTTQMGNDWLRRISGRREGNEKVWRGWRGWTWNLRVWGDLGKVSQHSHSPRKHQHFEFMSTANSSLASLLQCLLPGRDSACCRRRTQFTSRLWWIYWFAKRSVKEAFNDTRDVRHELLFLSPYLGISFLRNHFSWWLYKSLFRWAIDRVNAATTICRSWRKLSAARRTSPNKVV
jgi:hypothetical protein